MLESIPLAPPDAILGLTEAFKKDPNPDKINLSVGVYRDAEGVTPILKCVKAAEKRLLDHESSKSYLPINGSPEYARVVQNLLFGGDHEIVAAGRAATLHTPGGTGALRVASDFVKNLLPDARIWCTRPTWPNHPNVFAAAGLGVESFDYFDAAENALAFDAMIAGLEKIPAGHVVVLHACCHNPSGVDPTGDQWRQIADTVYGRRLLPLLDFAYQGFGDGLNQDAAGLLEFCRPGCELIVCSSFSKNFGLYNERVGALTFVGANPDSAAAVLSQMKACVRANYSNPPCHGGAIVSTVLQDDELKAEWATEVDAMRHRINGMRDLFVQTMKEQKASRDFSFIRQQRGMFSFSGLSAEQVDQLRDKYSIYAVRSGRINVAGITASNIERLCRAIGSVL